MATGWSTQAEQINVLQGVCFLLSVVIVILWVFIWRVDRAVTNVAHNVQTELAVHDSRLDGLSGRLEDYATKEELESSDYGQAALRRWVDDLWESQREFEEKVKARLPIMRRL